jgi:hypothetical protein
MNKSEFIRVIAYLEAGCGRALAKESVHVYFDLLGDLDASVFEAAARIVILEHPWASFPSIAELRDAAATVKHGNINRMTAAEAWELAWKAIKKTDPEVRSTDRYLEELPPLVRRAVDSYGLSALCYGKEPIAIVRAQFMRIFDDLAGSDERLSLLPIALKKSVEHIGDHPCKQVSAVVAMLPSIGSAPPKEK